MCLQRPSIRKNFVNRTNCSVPDKPAPTSGTSKHLKSASNFRKVSGKKSEGKEEAAANQNAAKEEENDRSAATFSGDETTQERLQPIGASNTSMLADDVEMGKNNVIIEYFECFQYWKSSRLIVF